MQAEFAAQDLEIAVPFTTPDLTKAALRDAGRLSSGLHAHVRLIRVQVVPYPLDINCSPVPISVLQAQLAAMVCALPVTVEIYLGREFASTLAAALRPQTLTVLGSKRRPWRTSQEKLAAQLKRAGHYVLVCYLEAKHA